VAQALVPTGLTRWGATPAAAAAVADDLLARYAQPHRRYHTLEHIGEVLDVLARLAVEDAVTLAAWFHDAVYDPARADNEERSARLAERMLADTDLAAATVGEVARLVRLTETHDPAPGDQNGAVLCDADLAVLAGDPAAYAAYAAAVREEYAFVPDDAFVRGRADVLRGLLARPAIFRTASARDRFEAAARHNIETELTLLRAMPAGPQAPADHEQ
jgi:predicted metal-dependent HD superfamily phosphohydrolase